jgi:hypothetical protein
MFNPLVHLFRIHWFSVRPCCGLVSSESLSRFGTDFLNPKHYYQSKMIDHALFSVSTLGRRSLHVRKVNGKIYRPHKFWSKYMSEVAGHEYRGPWLGLAPMHFQFKPEPGKKLFCIQPELQQHPEKLLADVTGIRAFPKAYLCPIGWIVAISADIEGSFPLNAMAPLIGQLRSGRVFLHRGKTASLKDVICTRSLAARCWLQVAIQFWMTT